MISILLTALLVSTTPLSVATTDDGLSTLANPAGLGTARDFNLYYFYNFSQENFWSSQTFAMQAGNLGISYIDLADFRVGVGSKLSDGFLFGTNYRKVKNKSFWDAGIIIRPNRFVSLGAVVQSIGHRTDNQYIVGIGIRPITNRLTLTCDFYSDQWNKPSIGLETEPINGLEIKGKINTDGAFAIQAGISLGKLGLGSVLNSTTKNNYQNWSGYVRINSDKRRSLVRPPKQFLELKLSGSIADQKPGFSLFGGSVAQTTYEILKILNKAKEDKQISGLVLKIEGPQMSFAIAQEIKSELNEFKKQGKKIIVYAPGLNNIGYYLASSGDEIITHPLGDVTIPGFSARAMHLKGAMDKLGIETEYERVGKYKSAPEMLAEDTLSLGNREVINSILDDYYQNITTTIASERNFTIEEVDNKINQGFFMASEAKENKLVDNLYYEDELDSVFKSQHPAFKKVSAGVYMHDKDYEYDWLDLPKISVIYASGDIAGGESGTDPLMGGVTCGANTIVKAIRNARKDKSVKAIILRIDSPGGDGFASDLIWREMSLVRKIKPLIVSMGPVAASGGYYIAMAGDKIFASPATITGSIGAFSLKFVTQELYSKLGITTETIKRGEHADAFSSDRKFTEQERTMLKRHIDEFYSQFIEKVAQGRNLTKDYVDSVGQGRVWTGNQAKDRMLVDSIGGLLDAIDYAKVKANIQEVKLEFLPKPKQGFINWTMTWLKTVIHNYF